MTMVQFNTIKWPLNVFTHKNLREACKKFAFFFYSMNMSESSFSRLQQVRELARQGRILQRREEELAQLRSSPRSEKSPQKKYVSRKRSGPSSPKNSPLAIETEKFASPEVKTYSKRKPSDNVPRYASREIQTRETSLGYATPKRRSKAVMTENNESPFDSAIRRLLGSQPPRTSPRIHATPAYRRMNDGPNYFSPRLQRNLNKDFGDDDDNDNVEVTEIMDQGYLSNDSPIRQERGSNHISRELRRIKRELRENRQQKRRQTKGRAVQWIIKHAYLTWTVL